MDRETFRLSDFLGPGDAFHFGRSRLGRDRRSPVPHDHDYFECFWISSGEGFHLINDQRVRLGPRSLVFMRPSDVHATAGASSEACVMVNVAFSASTAKHILQRYVDACAGRYFWAKTVLPVQMALDRHAFQHLCDIECGLERGDRSRLSIESFLLQLINGVVREPERVDQDTPAWLTAACRAASDPAVFRNGAAGFIKAAGRSHEHVCRVARKHLGQSPSEYVNQKRMSWAARQLARAVSSEVSIVRPVLLVC